jgi:alpha-1,6-mannosyltransferase
LAALHIGEWAEKPVRRHWADIYRRFDRTVAPSLYLANRLAESGVDGALALPLGVDTEVFRPDRGDKAQFRHRLGLSPRHRLLVFAGRPAREKRVDVLIEAVERLGEPYVLILVGAAAAEASGRVIEIPYQPDLDRLAGILASCDAFVHANDREPFGLVVLEAMACGLPVVGVDRGGVAETVDAAVGGLAPRSEADAFAQAVAALFARDIPAIGRAARRRVIERHGWDRVFEDLTQLYGEMTGNHAFAAPAALPVGGARRH